jgi:hypothetical protein
MWLVTFLILIFFLAQGVSRSAAIVIAYLIRKRGMSFDSAVAFVRQRRPCIKPNSGFVRCLQEWERQWSSPLVCSPAVRSVPFSTLAIVALTEAIFRSLDTLVR